MHVVAVINRKGGVGKTTTAVNVAAALALGGQRTLLVDLDPQGSASHALGLEGEDGTGIGEAFRARAILRPRYPPPPELFRLGVLPADERLAEQEFALADGRRAERLGRALRSMRDHWSVCILDTPPALGGLVGAALRTADAVLVPAATDYLASEALRGTLAAIRRAEKERGRPYAPLAILPTFVDGRRPGGQATLTLLRERFGALVLQSAVPRSARFDSAALTAVPVVLGAPVSAAGQAYADAARELLARLGDPAPRRSGGVVKAFARADLRGALRDLRRR